MGWWQPCLGLLPLLSLFSNRTQPGLSGEDQSGNTAQAAGEAALALPNEATGGVVWKKGIRLLGSHTEPGGPPRGWRVESVVTSGASGDGPGPGVRAGAGGPEPGPAGTAAEAAETPGVAGEVGQALPEVKDA